VNNRRECPSTTQKISPISFFSNPLTCQCKSPSLLKLSEHDQNHFATVSCLTQKTRNRRTRW